MAETTVKLVDVIRWTVSIDASSQTLTAIAHETEGDYRLEVPLDFVVPLGEILRAATARRPELFPFSYTRVVYEPPTSERGEPCDPAPAV